MALTDRLRSSAAPYLAVLLVAPMAALFAHFLDPTTAVFKGQPPGVLVAFALVLVAALLWLPYRPESRWPAAFHVFMGGLVATWAVAIALSIVHGDNFDLTALLVPVALLLVWLKQPRLRDAWVAADVFAWAVIVAAALSVAFDWLGWHELHHEGWNRLPLLQELIGPIERWEGPFGNVNLAGPIGAFLFAYGLYRRGVARIAFVAAGLLIVFFSDSRTSVLAIAAATVVAFMCADRLGSWRVTNAARWLAGLGLAGVVVVYVAVLDPTLNGRTDIWSAFVTLWQSSPVTGVGGAGIIDAIGAGSLPGWANHGHSILLDPLARVGVLGLIPLVVSLAAALLLTIRAARVGVAVGVVVLASFLASGLTEDVVDWRYVGYQLVPLLAAVMLSSTSDVNGRRHR